MKDIRVSLKKRNGFTLAELLIVVAIIAVLVAVSIPIFTGQLKRARQATCASNRTSLEHAFCIARMSDDSSCNEDLLKQAKTQVLGDANGATGCPVKDSEYTYQYLKDDGTETTGTASDAVRIKVYCSIEGHGESADTSGASTQAKSFTEYVKQWLADGNTLKSKRELYEAYYATHPAIKMSDEYKEKINNAGLNTTLKNETFYWWTYPVTDASGNVIYNVTYANRVSDPSMWTGNTTERGSIGGGYVVIVNGKTYIRGQSGKTVSPGATGQLYKTEDELENALKNNGYIVVQ